jgi:hypothetical protein
MLSLSGEGTFRNCIEKVSFKPAGLLDMAKINFGH